MYKQLSCTGVNYPKETEERYLQLTSRAQNLYSRCMEKIEALTSLVLLWQSFTTRTQYLTSWIEKVWEVLLRPALAAGEIDQESVLVKLMKFVEIDKRIHEKEKVKERIVSESESLCNTTRNRDVNSSLVELKEKWNTLRHGVRSQRQRLDELYNLWRTFQNAFQELDQWVRTSVIVFQGDFRDFMSSDNVHKELEYLQVR